MSRMTHMSSDHPKPTPQSTKQVNGKILKKKINVRIEHIRPSTSRKEWIERVKQNELQKKAVKAGEKREWLSLVWSDGGGAAGGLHGSPWMEGIERAYAHTFSFAPVNYIDYL